MELFKLIIFSTSLFLLGSGSLFDITLIYLFLKMVYKTNINYNNNIGPIDILVNLINIMMHFVIYQFDNFVNSINKTQSGSFVISSYNYLDSKIVHYKTMFFNWLIFLPIKYLMAKSINKLKFKYNKQTSEIKKLSVDSAIKLETNADISNFLDKLLDENKKTK